METAKFYTDALVQNRRTVFDSIILSKHLSP